MAIRHVRKYYEDISNMYLEMVGELYEQQEAFAEGKVEESAIQNLMMQVDNLSRDYQLLSYIMWLLNAPNKENKRKHYEKQTRAQLEKFRSEGVTQEQQEKVASEELNVFKEGLQAIVEE